MTAPEPRAIRAEILVPGSAATARRWCSRAPISFWGGVDPTTGAHRRCPPPATRS